jgi:hypothetical protein
LWRQPCDEDEHQDGSFLEKTVFLATKVAVEVGTSGSEINDLRDQ